MRAAGCLGFSGVEQAAPFVPNTTPGDCRYGGLVGIFALFSRVNFVPHGRRRYSRFRGKTAKKVQIDLPYGEGKRGAVGFSISLDWSKSEGGSFDG